MTLAADSRHIKTSDADVTSVEAVEWPDSSLGVPEQGKMYAQVITPGHRVMIRIPGGEILEVHTSATGAVLKH